MLATVVAVLCQMADPTACVEEIISDQVTFIECVAHAQIGIAKWMSEHPIYSHGWQLGFYKCVAGHYERKRSA